MLRAELAALVGSISAESRPRKTSADTIPKATMPPTPLVLADEHPSTTNVTPPRVQDSKAQRRDGRPAGLRQESSKRSPRGRVDGSDDISIAGGDFQPLSSVNDLYRHVPPSRMTPTTTRVEAAAAADRSMDFEDGGFVVALARTLVTRRTGLWLCEQGGVRKEVYTKQGVPAFVTSNLAGELLGEHLVKKRVINRRSSTWRSPSCRASKASSATRSWPSASWSPWSCFSTSPSRSERSSLDLFTWESGTATFYEGVDPPEQRLSAAPRRLGDPRPGIQRRIAAGFESKLILERGQDTVVQADRIDTASRDCRPPGRPPRRAQTLRDATDASSNWRSSSVGSRATPTRSAVTGSPRFCSALAPSTGSERGPRPSLTPPMGGC